MSRIGPTPPGKKISGSDPAGGPQDQDVLPAASGTALEMPEIVSTSSRDLAPLSSKSPTPSELGARLALQGAPETWSVALGDTVESIADALFSQGLTIGYDALHQRLRFNHPGIDTAQLPIGMLLDLGPESPRPPTGAELVKSPIIRKEIERAWLESKSDNPEARHEEGGWIYMNRVTGEVFVHRAPSGAKASIDLSKPTLFVNSVIVGTFHTHPNPSNEGWDSGPSQSDINMDNSRGVPGIIRNDQGYHPYAYERRESLEGTQFFPGTKDNPL